VRVGLADDSPLFRDGLAVLLEAAGIDVVVQVGTGHDLLAAAASVALDAAVVDIRMPPTFTEEGLDAADALRTSRPGVAVLVLSTYAETAYAMRTFRRGSARRGYLLKDAVNDPKTLRTALERLRAGGSVLDPSIVERLMAGTRRREPLSALTPDQRAIVRMITEGSAVDAIAQALAVDEPAARAQIEDTLRTLGITLEDPGRPLVSVLSWLRSDSPLPPAPTTS
jgi:DNA-binding NarL/FixJ family response regulator